MRALETKMEAARRVEQLLGGPHGEVLLALVRLDAEERCCLGWVPLGTARFAQG